MNVVVDRIETAGPDGRARRISFCDEAEPRLTSAAVVKELGIESGLSAVLEDLEASIATAERRTAKERALRILGARERSAHEVLQRLVDDGYPHGVANHVVQRLTELGLIDDERFAGMWTRSRFAAGYGSRRVLDELGKRGIEPATAQRAVETTGGESDELRRAVAALRGRSASSRRERERLIRRLVSRGFDLRVAISAIDDDGTSVDR